jgi:hypothetical protein
MEREYDAYRRIQPLEIVQGHVDLDLHDQDEDRIVREFDMVQDAKSMLGGVMIA